MKEVLINCSFGGFSFSPLAITEYAKRNGVKLWWYKEVQGKGLYNSHHVKVECPVSGNLYGYMGVTKDMGDYVEDYDSKEEWTPQYSELYDARYEFNDDAMRTDPLMISIVKELGFEKSSGECSSLDIEEYDDENFNFTISEYDGNESLELIPVVSISKLKSLNEEEIKKYFDFLGVTYKA